MAVYWLVSSSVYIITVVLACSVYLITRELASGQFAPNVLAYLGLDIPRWRHIAVAMAGLAVWIGFTNTVHLTLFGNNVGWRSLLIHHSAQMDGSLIWLWLATIVATPIGEELLYRGFMFRGFVHAPRDAIPSIVLISLIWSLTHTQYNWLFIAELFVIGLLLGFVRWRTGSTTLPIILHMLYNLHDWIGTEFVG